MELMSDSERQELANRLLYFYHRVLLNIRNWIFEGDESIDIARDTADFFESLYGAVRYASTRQDYDEVYQFIKRRIAVIEERFFTAERIEHLRSPNPIPHYREIFDLSYDEFVKKYFS